MSFADPEKKLSVDLRLYAIVDPEHAGGRALPDLARAVAAGGATLVQLRDKVHEPRAMVELTRAIKAALPPDVPLIVNDRVDVAREAGADGVSVIAALSLAPDPAAAARELRAIVDAALEKHAPVPPATGAGGHFGAAP